MTELDNYGIIYRKYKYRWWHRFLPAIKQLRKGPKYFLYKRYRNLEAMSKAIQNDTKLKELQAAGYEIYVVDLTDCPLPVTVKNKEAEDGS